MTMVCEDPESARDRDRDRRERRKEYMGVLGESLTARADALELPECPDWCSGDPDPDGDGELTCFRCWFTAERGDRVSPDEMELAAAPAKTE
jgi:hypothetical protein